MNKRVQTLLSNHFDKVDRYRHNTMVNYLALYAAVVIEALGDQPFVSVWKQTANRKSSWQRANFARYPSQSSLSRMHLDRAIIFTLKHAPAKMPLWRQEDGEDSLLCRCLVTTQLCSLSQADVPISHIAVLVSTHTAVGWCHY